MRQRATATSGRIVATASWLCVLAGCAAHTPAVEPSAEPLVVPQHWQSPESWELARPADELDKGPWWRLFDDPRLNDLIEQAQRGSPTVAGFAARLRQAEAAAQFARADLLPRIDASLRSTRQKTSANRPTSGYDGQAVSTVQNDTAIGVSVSYEVDLFDRIALGNIVASANARQAQADLANARLVLAADLAASYFALRQIDAEMAIVARSIELQSRAADLLNIRYAGGAVSKLDAVQQQALLDSTRVQLELLQRQRPLVEHALASLVGQPASGFSLAPQPAWNLPAPAVPLALPAAVLQRRPDIGAAQHALAAANAQIGIARSASYPNLVIGAGGGLESRRIASLLDGPSLVWSLGAAVTQVLFDGGRNAARVAGARAGHEAANAAYRRIVLQAMQEVEDGLSSLQALTRAAQSAQAAIASADQALDIAQARYAGGLATSLDMLTAQQGALNSHRQAVQIKGQQLAATTYLVKALGGGWGDDGVARP